MLRAGLKVSGCLVLVMLGWPAALVADTGSDSEIIAECTSLVRDYAFFRDRPAPEKLADLFTEDAKLTVNGESVQGRSAIEARARVAGLTYRPLMSTTRIEVTGPDTATGVSYATVYLAPTGQFPLKVAGPAGVGEYHDSFVLTENGWKIAHRTFVLVFQHQDSE